MADALDSGSSEHYAHRGSSPLPRTTRSIAEGFSPFDNTPHFLFLGIYGDSTRGIFDNLMFLRCKPKFGGESGIGQSAVLNDVKEDLRKNLIFSYSKIKK